MPRLWWRSCRGWFTAIIKMTETGLHLPAGYHSVVWDGRDRAGRPLPSGVYIARLVAGDFVAGIRMVLLK